VDQVERAKNRTKSKVGAKVEHPIRVISGSAASPRCAIAGSERTLIAARDLRARQSVYRAPASIAPPRDVACPRLNNAAQTTKGGQSIPLCRRLGKSLCPLSTRQPLVQTFPNQKRTGFALGADVQFHSRPNSLSRSKYSWFGGAGPSTNARTNSSGGLYLWAIT
jgi:hypothetical protein